MDTNNSKPISTITVTLVQDPDNPESLLLDLGLEICERLGWKPGDTIDWEQGPNGSFILRKCHNEAQQQ